MRTTTRLASALLIFAGSVPASATSKIDADWKAFQTNSARYMNTRPVKLDGGARADKRALFSSREIATGRFVTIKRGERNLAPKMSSSPHLSEFAFEGMPNMKLKLASFLDLDEMEKKGLKPLYNLTEVDKPELRNATLEVQPWSGDYWPIYQGGLGSRYAMASDGHSRNEWSLAYGSFKAQGSLAEILERGDETEIDSLSPSEKYDALIGEPRSVTGGSFGFLTPLMWQEGQEYANEKGRVEHWMGLCHGWAPASLNEPRPVKTIEAKAASGNGTIHLYPTDLKGLSTLAWAKNDAHEHLVGGRCGSKNPRKDPETGRLLDQDCFDVNPGLWHLAIINQIGLVKRGFVIDATYDYEVWNQPVFSYEISYFNPQTGAPSETATEALVRMSEFTKDKFAKFRKGNAGSVVGVKMTIKYVAETSASHSKTDSPENDRLVSTTYTYDLEISTRGDIVGGEWYQNAHPDFLWLTEADSHPNSIGDAQITGEAWNPEQPLPNFWKEIAVRTAVATGAPLARIIEPLMHHAAE
jgi:hypothetical protein